MPDRCSLSSPHQHYLSIAYSFNRANTKAKKHLKPSYIDTSDIEIGWIFTIHGTTSLHFNAGISGYVIIFIINRKSWYKWILQLISAFNSAFQVTSLQNQLILQEDIKDLKTIILRSLSTPSQLRSSNIVWPIKNQEQLQQVNEIFAADNTLFNLEVTFFSRLGGDSVTLAVNNTLKAIIKHEFALILRFTDSSNKAAFGGTLCCKLVKESVRQFYYKDGNVLSEKIKLDLVESRLDSFIAKWLRDSVNRGEEGKQKRSKAKNAGTEVNKAREGPEAAESNAESD
ncbi:uncharacterized protein LOC118436395 [Folsomia candida]|uniref:uncharacterized protein LOC118436395 n=1 Tax=Folsomia candida TaxID=158441 RepID=UPI001604F45E|nr:uncharacterized protein LOC118436395 [Folsomia candida]